MPACNLFAYQRPGRPTRPERWSDRSRGPGRPPAEAAVEQGGVDIAAGLNTQYYAIALPKGALSLGDRDRPRAERHAGRRHHRQSGAAVSGPSGAVAHPDAGCDQHAGSHPQLHRRPGPGGAPGEGRGSRARPLPRSGGSRTPAPAPGTPATGWSLSAATIRLPAWAASRRASRVWWRPARPTTSRQPGRSA